MKVTVYAKTGCELCQSIVQTFQSHAVKGLLTAEVEKVVFPNWNDPKAPSPSETERKRLSDAQADMIANDLYDTPAVSVAVDGKQIWGAHTVHSLKQVPFATIWRASQGSQKDLDLLRSSTSF